MSRKGYSENNKKGTGKPKSSQTGNRGKKNDNHFKKGGDHFTKKRKGDPLPTFSDEVRINKYIANAGICSRREADVLIKTGIVEVNGTVVQELGYKVKPGDEVRFDGQLLKSEKKQYVLLNKPKDFTVSPDKQVGRTVMHLTAGACKEHIIPVGKMDKMWTGLILLTNDTDMIKKLTHPKHAVNSIYHIELLKPLSREESDQLIAGVELKDGGFVKVEKIEILKTAKGREIGIEIKSSKNRAIERMMEIFGNTVVKLDKVSLAGLTKKDIPRGTWRHLNQQEIDFLKMA